MLAALTDKVHWMSLRGRMQFVYPILLFAVALFFLHDYLKDAAVTLLAGIAAIAATAQKKKTKTPQRFVIAAFVMLALTWLVPVKTLLYLAAGFVCFFWVETKYCRIHFLGVLALLLASPAYQYAINVFSFPIRLQLTKLVGAMFSVATTDIELKGNVIFYGGQEFAVDPACMGIHMLSISMLLGICLLGLLQRKANRTVGWKMIILYLACLLLLNLLANAIRILLLVQFAIPAEAAMHDVVGLLCLLFYVCVPACFLAKKLVTKTKVNSSLEAETKPLQHLHWFLLMAMFLVAQRVASVDTFSRFAANYSQPLVGYTSSVSAPGILKVENKQALIYVKFIRGFYDTDHNPSLCWKGSGYTFTDVKKQVLNGHEVFTARLQKNKDGLYTAWWYGDDRDVMTAQTEWRWKMLKENKTYALINITAATEDKLAAEMKKLSTEQALQPLFTNP